MIKIIDKEIDKKYIKKISKLSFLDNSKSKLKIVYTSIHGTGIRLVPKALKAFGFKNIIITKSQENTDPYFSTVKSPNPENEDALKEGIKELKKNNADILLATANEVFCAEDVESLLSDELIMKLFLILKFIRLSPEVFISLILKSLAPWLSKGL